MRRAVRDTLPASHTRVQRPPPLAGLTEEEEEQGDEEAAQDGGAPAPDDVDLLVVRGADEVHGLDEDQVDGAGEQRARGEAGEAAVGRGRDLGRDDVAREQGHAAEGHDVHEGARQDHKTPRLRGRMRGRR